MAAKAKVTHMKIIQKNTLELIKYLSKGSATTNIIWQASGGLICKEVLRAAIWDPVIAQKMLETLSNTPYTNSVVGLLYDGDQFLGWCERWIHGLRSLSSRDGHHMEREVYRAHCLYQAYLLDRAYIDIDGGMTNWAQDGKGGVFTFDKDKVFSWPNPKHKVWFNFQNGSYFHLLRQSFSQVPESLQQQLSDAALTNNAEEFAKAFRKTAGQLYAKLPTELEGNR